MTQTKKHCLLHFGMHKTGSSSIQASLFRKSLGGRYHYVDLGTDNPTGPLLNIFQDSKVRYHDIGRRGARLSYESFLAEREALMVRFRKELSAAGPEALIVSAEGLNVLSETELEEFFTVVREYMDTIEAFAYIRPPKGFMESMFQQLVKGQLGRFDLEKLYPGYCQRFEKFERVFGRSHVRYRVFDPKLFAGGCVVQDFCAMFGIPLPKEEIVRVNEGLSRNAVALLYVFRKYAREIDGIRHTMVGNRRLVEELGKVGGTKLCFAQDVVDAVLKQNEADLAWMEERVGVSLRGSGGTACVDAVRDEADLLRFDPDALRWLGGRIGATECGAAPTVVSARQRSGDNDGQRLPSLNPRSLVGIVRRTVPESIDGVSEAEAVKLVEEVFALLCRELTSRSEGRLTVPCLGGFGVHTTKRVAEGVERVVEKIMFRPMSREQEVALWVDELLGKLSHSTAAATTREASAR